VKSKLAGAGNRARGGNPKITETQSLMEGKKEEKHKKALRTQKAFNFPCKQIEWLRRRENQNLCIAAICPPSRRVNR
jgi:hypothetical protein